MAERTMPPVRADELAGVDDASWAAVRTERFDPVLGQSNRRPGLLDGSETLIRNHVRREHLQDGRTVRHFVVTLPVKPTGNLGDADVRGLETRLQKMLDQTLNSGYKLPRSGDQLRVTLELEPVSRHGEAITLTQSRNPGRADQLHWDVEHGDGTLVHEVLHYLGLPDEYLDTVDGKKSDATHLFRRDGRLTGVHETGPMSRTERADLDALAVDHLKRIEDISDTANIPSHAAHTVPPQSSDTTGAQPPAQNSPSNSGADPSTSSHRRSRLVPDNDPAHPVSASPWHGHAGAGPGTGQPYGAPSSSGANPVFVPPRFQRQNTFTVQQTSSDFIANVQVSSNYQAPNVLLHNVNIGDIRLSNQDRPDTQYSFLDRGQQNHTVAWTLIRDALKYHEHRPAADLIGYIELGLQSLDRQNNQESYIDTTRGAHARFSEAMRKAEELLREIKVNQAPLGEWQQALAKLISLYVEAYQLSPSATFGGRSGGNAEANSMRILRRQNTLPENERMSSGELASLVESLYDSPPIARHKEHSREHLLHAVAARFPNLVYPLSSQYPEYHNMRQNYPGINQALAQGFFQSEFLDSRQGNDALLARLPYGVLDSGFVVNAEVDRDAQNNLGIAHLEMSRRERPPTQYISAQRSHVMAWSLVMNSTRGALIQKPVADALLWVWGRLQHCEAAGGPVAALDDWNALGHGIRQKLDVAEQLLATEPSPQFWSSLLSMLIHGCLTLENSSRLATTGGPAGDLGAAVGHGEARTHERMMHGGSMQQEEAREVARGFLDDGAIRTTIINEIMKNAGRPIRGQPAVDPMLRIEAFNQRLDSDPGIRVILNNMAQAVSSAYPNVQFGDRESLVDYWHARMRAVPDGDSNSSGTPFNEAERALLWLP
ncbi:hypothetical protein [Streptomyces clavuligerus]|uniref:hypothetical protein n=1 Tax=Streptomyces clavuligerus TaxID=1901 RepID=UPI001E586404|nr:hypothetical protein [Streptomyces clavuligerus]